jgi:hypothetical protein
VSTIPTAPSVGYDAEILRKLVRLGWPLAYPERLRDEGLRLIDKLEAAATAGAPAGSGLDWRDACVIVPDYVAPYAKEDSRPSVVVRYGEHWFLRYSSGPKTGTFWDAYGDDFLNVELAEEELAKAPEPPAGKPFLEFKLSLPSRNEDAP